jgi:hypothetical protein
MHWQWDQSEQVETASAADISAACPIGAVRMVRDPPLPDKPETPQDSPPTMKKIMVLRSIRT